ncbi:DoxX family membrane protein [Occultella glacieicola]|uniref:DoxX family membrane protein n=1 Tax=Occultella glacieicola TaxID=2518684 RepID=A0ABY2E3U5_9MICO|nr:DoxX family membrane protein [Occultella glacieicola]TDE94082.1 DoxX family membrane protein [Occultella glacieicola]
MSTQTALRPPPVAPPATFSTRFADWADRHGVTLLRVAVGLIFLVFGIPKFFPGASPVETLVMDTVEALSLGLVSGQGAMVAVALLETFIGLTLVTGTFLRLGLLAMGGATVGFFAPVVLFAGDLFGGGLTLEAQYIIKDIVLVAAAVVIAARALRGRVASLAR